MADKSLGLVERSIQTIRRLIERGWYDEALPLLDDARLLHPQNTDLVTMHAEVYARQGKLVEALQVLVGAYSSFPGDPELRLRLGQFLAIDGLHVAMDLFDRTEEDHEYPALVIVERAMTLADLGRYAEAQKEVERALSMEPEYLDAWMELGRLKIEVGDWAGAIKPLRRAVDYGGPTPDLLVDLAAAYLHQGFIDEAEKCIAQGEALEEGNPGLAYYRAAVAASRGDTGAALGHLKRALDSGHEGIRRLLQADRFFDAMRDQPELADLKGTLRDDTKLRRFIPRRGQKEGA